METIESPRLLIRRYTDTEADAAAAFALYGDPRVMAFIPVALKDRGQAAEFVARQAKMDDDARGCWHGLVVCLRQSGEVIGEVGMFVGPEAEATGDVGYMLRPETQGRGYATEAAAAMIGHGFDHWQLRRVTAGCDARNDASQRVIERLGMRRMEGMPDESAKDASLRYELTRGEWLARQR